jgi:hypothetical protein
MMKPDDGRRAPSTLYEFTLTLSNGHVVAWTHLTKRETTMLQALAPRINPLRSSDEVRAYEWKEML